MRDTDLVQREFAKQAASFEDPRYVFGDPRLMDWLIDGLPLDGADTVLEVAAGTGHVSRAIASRVRQVVALDVTPEMLATGRQAARAAGIVNVLFQLGDAASLPFLDESFDLVFSRFAVHHFTGPERHVGEMARVGGRVAVMDLVTADGEPADTYNELERRRDPSHVWAFPAPELRALFEAAGLALADERARDHVLDVERWLAQSSTPEDVAEEIRGRLRDELAGGARTGMRPSDRDGKLCFTQSWRLLVFARPSPAG